MSQKYSASYWICPVKSSDQSAETIIETLVGRERFFAFSEGTKIRGMKPGDWICFYASKKGVIAQALVLAQPEKKTIFKGLHLKKYPWMVRLDNVHLYLENPVKIDVIMRKKLDAFRNRDPNKNWAWFVMTPHKISENDFNILTS